jgi:alpha-glucosidase (family GH31 glycosyl hydrolase)
MFGSSILVVPKTYVNPDTLESTVLLDFPETEDRWFNFNTQREVTHFNQTMILQYFQQAIFVRQGSILPLLNHKRELSLQEALKNPIRIQVYGSEASGFLYLDSNENDEVATVISFTFSSNRLTYETQPAHKDGSLLDTSSTVIN